MKLINLAVFALGLSLAACVAPEPALDELEAPITLTAVTPEGESLAVDFSVASRSASGTSWRAVTRGAAYVLEGALDDDGGSIEVRDASNRWLTLAWSGDGHTTLTRFDGITSYSNCGAAVPAEAMVAEQPVMLALLDPALLQQLAAIEDGVGVSQQALRIFNNGCPGASCGGGAYTCCCAVGDRCVVGTGTNAECWCEPARKSVVIGGVFIP